MKFVSALQNHYNNTVATRPQQWSFYVLLLVWWLSGAVCIFAPVIQWNGSRDAYYNMYGRYVEYQLSQEQAQRAYEQAQKNQNYNYNNNNNNNNNNQYGGDNSYSYYGFQDCEWYQFACRRKQHQLQKKVEQYRQQQQQQNGGSRDGSNLYTPGWYQFLGGKATEEGRREREEMGLENANAEGSNAVKFVYAWSMVLFISLLGFGTIALYWLYRYLDYQPTKILLLLLLVTLQYSLLLLVLLPQGVIMVDDRDLEDSIYGWYGQWPVLLVYTQYAICLFSGIFTFSLGGYLVWENRRKKIEEKEAAYHPNDQGGSSSSLEAEKQKEETVYDRMI